MSPARRPWSRKLISSGECSSPSRLCAMISSAVTGRLSGGYLKIAAIFVNIRVAQDVEQPFIGADYEPRCADVLVRRQCLTPFIAPLRRSHLCPELELALQAGRSSMLEYPLELTR